jgi:hypothetical protein
VQRPGALCRQLLHGGSPLSCPSPSQCQVGVCIAGQGCDTAPVPDGSSCDDGLSGTIGDACSAGVCQGLVPQCFVDSDCDDNSVCNGSESCQGNVCVAGAALSCAAPSECTIGVCDAVSGCQVDPQPDGVACSGGLCLSGSCQAVDCVTDSQCDDLDPCTGQERCVANFCAAGTPLACAAPSQCEVGVCLPGQGCAAVPVADGSSCDDGLSTTGADACFGGVCQGTLISGAVCIGDADCAAPLECTVGVCDASSGCQVAPATDGTLCASGGGVCVTGSCLLIDCTIGTRRQQQRCWEALSQL